MPRPLNPNSIILLKEIPMFVLAYCKFCPRFVKKLASILVAIGTAAVACLAPQMSAAQPAPTIAIVQVTPVNAPPGVARTVTISGQWPDSCVPGIAVDNSLVTQTRILLVSRVTNPIGGRVCLQVLTPYRFEFAYTPTESGITRVLVDGSASTRGEGRIVTTTNGAIRAAKDISGNWYDPGSNGSGLTFTHGYLTSDAVFGTWFVYDRSGVARWYSIQNVVWKDSGSFEGVLYETAALPGKCSIVIADPACPQPNVIVKQIGTVKAIFTGIFPLDDTAPQAKIEAFSPTNELLFSSRVIPISL
jgi:hypothetical protein